MKILLCNYEYPPLGGGGGVVMAALARHLAKRHEVTVLTSRGPGQTSRAQDEGVEVIRVPVMGRTQLAVASLPSMLSYVPMAALEGLRMRKRGRFDVINTHFVVPSGPAGHLLSAAYGVPNVLSVHGGDLFDPSKALSPHRHWVLRSPIRHLLRRADAVVGQSTDTVRHVAGIYGVHREVDLIPLGIDRPPVVAPAAREHFGLPSDAFVLVTVGRLVPRKSTGQLIAALARSGLVKAHLLIVGDGPDAEPLRAAAAEAGLADRVHLLGLISETEKHQALQAADVFVSTSQHEGFGLVFLEAMAAGLPIVCYDRGGQVDFLASGRTGCVEKLNDLEAFTMAIRRLHDSPEDRRRFGEANRAIVSEYFIDRCAERYEEVFRRVVARGGNRARL